MDRWIAGEKTAERSFYVKNSPGLCPGESLYDRFLGSGLTAAGAEFCIFGSEGGAAMGAESTVGLDTAVGTSHRIRSSVYDMFQL